MASQVAFVPVSLPELIEQSDLIVTASPADPFTTSSDAERLRFTEHHYVVQEVLFGYATPGESLSIRPSTFPAQRVMHAAYIKDGTRRSPIYPRYDPAVDSPKGERVLFLSYQSDALGWTAIDAFDLDTPTLRKPIGRRDAPPWDDALAQAMDGAAVASHPSEPGVGAARVARVLRAEPDRCWVVVPCGRYTGRHNSAYAEAPGQGTQFVTQLVKHGVPKTQLRAMGLPERTYPGPKTGDGQLQLTPEDCSR